MTPRRRPKRLHSLIFFWLVGAIILATIASGLAVTLVRDHDAHPASVVSRNVQGRLSRIWDDQAAVDAYVAQLREDTGLALKVHRNPDGLPARLRVRPARGIVVFDGSAGYIPVVQRGTLVGALEVQGAEHNRAAPTVLVPTIATLLVLGLVARKVAKRIARPLEDVARAANDFGAGKLDARTRVGSQRRVAGEVLAVADAFDNMAARIERTVRGQQELLGAISHELRSPLARARVALEISKDRSAEPALETLGTVERELDRVDGILGDLLDAARAGLSDLHREDIDLAEFLQDRLPAELSPRPVEFELGPNSRPACVDAKLMLRAVSNLVRNAFEHGHPDTSAVVVHLHRNDNELVIIVRDSGPGFDQALLPKLFEPFVRKDPARTPAHGAGGVGLGLSLVRRIAEAHGGTAVARNRMTGDRVVGAEVELRIPV
jgi:two-component system, OmpR family, sensor kinase